MEQLQKIIISDNYGKPYIENNAALKWPNVDDDKIDKSQNKTNDVHEDAVTLLLSDMELMEQMVREGKKEELKKGCSFDTWIEERYMNIVY